MNKPNLGSVDKAKLDKLGPSRIRMFLTLSLLWSAYALVQGLRLLNKGETIDGVLMLLTCLAQLFLAFLFWCIGKAMRSPDWQGNWFVRVRRRVGDDADDRNAPPDSRP